MNSRPLKWTPKRPPVGWRWLRLGERIWATDRFYWDGSIYPIIRSVIGQRVIVKREVINGGEDGFIRRR